MPNKYPTIFCTIFGDEEHPEFTARDATINSEVIREACAMVRPRLIDGMFGTGRNWRITIKDRHDDEKTPHYVLDFGEGRPEDPACTLEIGYCDNFSKGVNDIEQKPGTFTVEAAGDFGNYSKQLAATVVARAYAKALDRNYPDISVLVDDRTLDTPDA